MSPAHQVHWLRDRESLPTGHGVLIPREMLMTATPGDDVVLHERGTDDERHGTVVDLVKDHGAEYIAVTFDDTTTR